MLGLYYKNMQSYAYLFSLILSLAGLFYLDYKKQLAWFWNARKTAVSLAIGLVFFLAWDITGIVLNIFSTNQVWVSGVYVVTPNLPIEEFLFLTLLCYQTVLLWRWQITKPEKNQRVAK